MFWDNGIASAAVLLHLILTGREVSCSSGGHINPADAFATKLSTLQQRCLSLDCSIVSSNNISYSALAALDGVGDVHY